MSLTFVLAGQSSHDEHPPQSTSNSPTLNLLPFSLGPSSKPYTSNSSPISSYFQPRPAPSTSISNGVSAGKPIATFRGRQVVGQRVNVPRGYKGVILETESIERAQLAYASTSKSTSISSSRIDDSQGDHSVRSGLGRGKARAGVWPLTPETSSSSVVPSIHDSDEHIQAQTQNDGEDDEDGLALRRSPRKSAFTTLKQRVKGAGQIALARPKRAVAKTARKRIRLDSDDDDDEDEGDDIDEGRSLANRKNRPNLQSPPPSTAETSSTFATPAPINRTPSKRAKTTLSTTTPTRSSPRFPRTPASALGTANLVSPSTRVPAPFITLQEATPLKSPLPPPPPHMALKKGGQADFVIGDNNDGDDAPVTEELQARINEDAVSAGGSVTGTEIEAGATVAGEGEGSTSTLKEDNPEVDTLNGAVEGSGIIPSPATENDPPTFPIDSPIPYAPTEDQADANRSIPNTNTITVKTEIKKESSNAQRKADIIEIDIPGPLRVLRPTSHFDSFTLWTPDSALAGYVEPSPRTGSASGVIDKSDSNGNWEIEKVEVEEAGKDSGDTSAQAQAQAQAQTGGEETGPKVRPSWWAQGGAGEGGDGVVRALGEFIGMMEMIHEPIYALQEGDDEDDDEENEDD